jgi:cadmium resistance protein CadD (predicted permease)
LEHTLRFLIAAIVAFAAANVGDLLVLLLFFADRRFRSWQVIAGQYLGVSAVIVLCLIGAAAASYLPHGLIRALGVVPIVVGVYKLVATSKEDERPTDMPRRSAGLSKVLAVAGISFADCSDNLAVFTPIYAHSNTVEKTTITVVFLILIGVWCATARYFTRHQRLGERVRKVGNSVAPFALVGLGLFIIFWS